MSGGSVILRFLKAKGSRSAFGMMLLRLANAKGNGLFQSFFSLGVLGVE